jgi:hypothetical protein
VRTRLNFCDTVGKSFSPSGHFDTRAINWEERREDGPVICITVHSQCCICVFTVIILGLPFPSREDKTENQVPQGVPAWDQTLDPQPPSGSAGILARLLRRGRDSGSGRGGRRPPAEETISGMGRGDVSCLLATPDLTPRNWHNFFHLEDHRKVSPLKVNLKDPKLHCAN